jgi:hypothetical protein
MVVRSSGRPIGPIGPVFRGAFALVLLAALFGLGCSNYADMLQRAQGYYEDDEYERALAVFRQLEEDRGALGEEQRVRYFYLRGMTDYRLGYHSDARYWLGLARVSIEQARSALREDELARLKDTLSDLDGPVFGIQDSKSGSEPGVALIPCSKNADCGSGLLCEGGLCRPTEEAVNVELSEEPAASPPPSPPAATPPAPSSPPAATPPAPSPPGPPPESAVAP